MKILVIDEMHFSLVKMLQKQHHEVTYAPQISRSEIGEIVSSYDGLIIRSKTPMDQELLSKAENLKFIARAGAGLDQVDLDYLHLRGIKLFHAAEGNRDAVAEHAVGMLLALMNHLPKSDQEIRRGIWNRAENRGHELSGKTVGIMGFGNMGKAFAKRLQGFGVKIIAFDKYKRGFGNKYVKEVSWKKLKQEADILSVHVPLTLDTRDFFTIEELGSFKKPIWFANTARGEVISFENLNVGLDRGFLKGAVLDVLENENFQKFSPAQQEAFNLLVDRGNVLFSPHVAGWTYESYEKINKVLVKKIKKSFK